MNFSKFILFVLVVIVTITASTASFTIQAATTPSSYVNLFTTWTTILSGGLSDCATPSDITATDCEGGLAAADAYIRNHTNVTNEPFLFSWTLDRNAPFVQMHPLDWGVNRYVLQSIFNYTHFRATHATVTSTRNMTYLQDENFPFLLSNALVPPSSLWIPYMRTIYFDDSSKIALITIQSGREPNSFDSVTSAKTALEIVSRRSNGPWYPVILYDDSTISYTAFVSEVTDSSKVVLKPAAVLMTDESVNCYQANGTFVCGFKEDDNEIDHHRFGLHPTIPSTFATTDQVIFDLRDLDQSLKDYDYIQKQIALKAESDKAAANDPVVGTTGFMPFTRSGNFRMCYRGECELGNMWTDAMRWKAGADIAFESAGGLRGPGWAAGNVRVSDLWAALPFANQLCTGTISGVTLFKIMNYSISQATFTSTKTNTGDRLLQISGARVTYNTNLPENDRVVSIEVLNKQTNQYEPIERLKLYTFATNSFMCGFFDPYPDFFKSAEIEGEVAGSNQDSLIQEIIATYLTSLSGPYDTTLEGRLVNQTSAPSSMESLVQTRATCSPNTFWREETQTCVPCNDGFVNPNPQESDSCVPKPEEENIIPLVVGIAVPVALLILGGVFYYFYRKDKMMRENVRDLEHAPKKTGDLAAMIFTDIQSSTALWSTAPLSMSAALDLHNKIINEIISKNNAYYVKSQGDSFFIAYDCTRDDVIDGCRGPQIAAKICSDIQRAMMQTAFPAAINQIYNAASEEDLLDVYDDPNELVYPEEGAIFNGLRIRIGLAIGTCEVKFDEVAKSYDYFGSLVNLAARTEASAHGGQVLVTNASTQYLKPTDIDCMMTSFGKFDLKGIPDQTELFQLMPIELAGRKKHFGGGGGGVKKLDGGGDGGDNDTASQVSSTHDESNDAGFESDDVNFLNALLRAVKPKEKETILRTLENSWRVRRNNKNQGETIASIAKKVGKVKTMMALQEERKAIRDGQTNVTALTGATGMSTAQHLRVNNNNNNRTTKTPSGATLTTASLLQRRNSSLNKNKYQTAMGGSGGGAMHTDAGTVSAEMGGRKESGRSTAGGSIGVESVDSTPPQSPQQVTVGGGGGFGTAVAIP